MAELLARVRSAFSGSQESKTDEWEIQRKLILEHMLAPNRGFQHYTKIMAKLVTKINQVLDSDHKVTEQQRAERLDGRGQGVLDSTEFDRANVDIRAQFCQPGNKDPWWKQDFPDMAKKKFNVVAAIAEVATNRRLIDAAFTQQDWMAPYQKILITTCISAYFRQTPAMYPVHQNMLFALKNSDIGSDVGKILEIPQAYISGAGPFLIKTLQQVSNGLDSNTHLKTITESVFSSIMPMTKSELDVVRAKLQVQAQYKNFREASIGSASIGETHIVDDPQGQPLAVLKFIKPVSAWLFLCEVDFLLTTVWLDLDRDKYVMGSPEAMNVKKCRQLLLFLIREFALEFDVEREAVGTIDAREIYYRPKIGIETPELLEWAPTPVPVLVLQYIKGQSLDEFMTDMQQRLKDNPGNKERVLKCLVPIQRRVAMLMALWLKELFWGSGRFDADPHKGNVIVPSCQDLLAGRKPFIALIDFGSHGKLGRRAQCIVFKTLIAGEKITQFKDCVRRPPTPETWSSKKSASDVNRLLELQPFLAKFKSFRSMSGPDQDYLFLHVDRKLQKLPKAHDQNVKHVRDVIRNIWKICNVREDPKETERLIDVAIDYGGEVDFGTIFLKVAQSAQTVGTCSSSSVLMYGRGLAYLDQMWRSTREMCAGIEDAQITEYRNRGDFDKYLMLGVEKCDRRKLVGLIWSFFITRPRLTLDYLTNCSLTKKATSEDESKLRSQSRTKSSLSSQGKLLQAQRASSSVVK